jgi:hypothetical protein
MRKFVLLLAGLISTPVYGSDYSYVYGDIIRFDRGSNQWIISFMDTDLVSSRYVGDVVRLDPAPVISVQRDGVQVGNYAFCGKVSQPVGIAQPIALTGKVSSIQIRNLVSRDPYRPGTWSVRVMYIPYCKVTPMSTQNQASGDLTIDQIIKGAHNDIQARKRGS